MTSIGQFFLALFVGWCFYMLAMAMTVYDGVGSLVVQPIIGLIVTSLALAPVFVVGLPLRWIGPLERFWRANWWLALVLGAVAVGLMVASWLPSYRVQYADPNLGRTIDSPHPWLGLGGWMLVMFAAGHFQWPQRNGR